MNFTSSQPSQAHYNSTIIYLTSTGKNLTQFIKVLLVKFSDMLHSSNFVKPFHRQSLTLYDTKISSSEKSFTKIHNKYFLNKKQEQQKVNEVIDAVEAKLIKVLNCTSELHKSFASDKTGNPCSFTSCH